MKNKTLFNKILCVLLAMCIGTTSFAIGFGKREYIIANAEPTSNISQPSLQKAEKDDKDSKENVESNGIKKEETVYVNLDPSGKIYSQIVSNRIHSNNKDVVINDKSDLKNIMPIKGGTLKKNKNGELIWNIEENDMYYRGTTERKMPMTVDIKYFLDGKEYKPENLVGKSGKLRIEINVKNNQANIVEIAGKPTTIYSPLVVMIGAVLKDDVFSNVDVDEGKVTVDGSKFVVSMTAMPGLNETLNMKNMSIDELKDIDFHDSFVITADVKDFEMGPIAIVASTEFPDVDTDGNTLDDMKIDLVDLKKMQDDLENMDGDHEIRSLFTDTKKSDAARLLIDDIFELYDLNRTILDVLPKYVTHDNVKHLEQFIDDIEVIDLEKLEDSQVLDYLEELFVKNNKPIDFDKLKTVVNTSVKLAGKMNRLIIDEDGHIKALIGSVNNLVEILDKFNENIGQNSDVKDKLLSMLKNSNIRKTFLAEGIKGVLKPEIMKKLSASMLNPPDRIRRSLPEEQPDESSEPASFSIASVLPKEAETPDSKLEETNHSSTSTNIEKEKLDKEVFSKQDGKEKVDEIITDTTTTSAKPLEKGEDAKNEEYAPVLGGKDKTEGDSGNNLAVDSSKNDGEKLEVDEGEPLSPQSATGKQNEKEEKHKDKGEKFENTNSEEVLGDAVLNSDKKEEKVLSANSSSPEVMLEIKADELADKKANEMAETINNLLSEPLKAIFDVMDKYNALNYKEKVALEFIKNTEVQNQLAAMAKYYIENEDNIDLMIQLLNATDSRQAKRIARTVSHLRDNIHDMKPQLHNLQRDIKKEGMRDSLRKSPEMIRTLVKMNGDLEDNRNISDILKRAVSEENSKTSKSMIETLDRLINENAINRYLANVDDIKELLERKDALVALSDNQPSYSGATDGTETSVRFVMKTDEIKKPEVKEEEPVKEESKGIIRRIIDKIFH